MCVSKNFYLSSDHIPAGDVGINLEEGQMIHLPYCLLSISNPSIYKSHAGALLLKALRMTDAAAAVVAVGRFPTVVSSHTPHTLVRYRSADWITCHLLPYLYSVVRLMILARNVNEKWELVRVKIGLHLKETRCHPDYIFYQQHEETK